MRGNCAFYHAFAAVFKLISAPFGETIMSSYTWIPQNLGVTARGRLYFVLTSKANTLKIEPIAYPPYAILRKFTRKGAAVLGRKGTGDVTALTGLSKFG